MFDILSSSPFKIIFMSFNAGILTYTFTILTFYLPEFENDGMKLSKCYSLFPLLLFTFLNFLFFNNLFFQELPFSSVAHVITTIDCQPTTANGVLVFVVGQLKVHVLL